MPIPTPLSTPPKNIVIAGGGIAGMFVAILLARQGRRVAVREKRPDPRNCTPFSGRSINFTLSARGGEMLRRAGLYSAVIKHAVPLGFRAVHHSNGTTYLQKYGCGPSEVLYAIRRSDLYGELLKAASNEPLIDFKFGHALEDIDPTANLASFSPAIRERENLIFDLFIGADGAYSKAQDLLCSFENTARAKNISKWGYLEFEIPPRHKESFNLRPDSLHLWPRNDSLVCAIPNSDGSFVGNLILPTPTFNEISSQPMMEKFFFERFPDLKHLLKDQELTFRTKKLNEIISTSVSKWHFGGNTILLGDACHATSPFLGQGMNAALEDASLLAMHLQNETISLGENLSSFQDERKIDADALSYLSELHLNCLSNLFGSRWQLAYNDAEMYLGQLFPSLFRPIYSLIAHSTEKYSAASERARKRQSFLEKSLLLATQILCFINSLNRAQK